MFSIDLLKGKELPVRMNLKMAVYKAVLIVIPLIAVTAFAAAYQHDKDLLQTCEQTLQQHQEQIELRAQDIAQYNKINRKIKVTEQCLNDISKALSYRIQISDLLIELTQAMPDAIFINEMKMIRSSYQKKIQTDDASQIKQKLMIRRDLKLTLCGYHADQSDLAVQEYVNLLEQSPVLSEIFTEIKASARQQGQIEDKDAIYYEIECALREQG